jgi:hypothetical protein
MMHLQLAAQQPTLITAKYSNQTIAEVLNDMAEKWSLSFAFDSYELHQYSGTWEFERVTPEAALGILFRTSPFTFKRIDDTFIIFPIARADSQIRQAEKERIVISGTVSDRLTGERLPYAGVSLIVAGVSAVTDEFGQFSLMHYGSPLSDTLAVAYVGYQPLMQALSNFGFGLEMRIELVPVATFWRDVVVLADSTPVAEVKIKPLFSQLNPDAFQLRYGLGEADIFRVAQILPGVSGSQEYSNGLYIRGSSSDQCQLLFDGFNIYHQDHFFGLISSINAYAVKSIRLNKGPADVTQGGRAAGIMELTGKEGDLRNASGRIELGTLSLSGAVEAPLDSSGRASVFISGRRSITDAIQSPAFKQLFNTLYSSSVVYAKDERINAFDGDFKPALLFQDGNAKLTFRPNDRAYLNLAMYASRDDLEFSYADTSSNEALNVSDLKYNDETAKINRGIALRWNQQINARLEAFTSVGFSKFNGSYFSSDSIRNNLFLIDSTQFSFRSLELRDWTARHYWQRMSANHTIKTGIAANAISISDRKRSSAFETMQSSAHAIILTAFAGDDWNVSQRLAMHFGARLNYHTLTHGFYPEPRWSMNWVVFQNRLQTRVSAGRTYQFIQRSGNQSLYQNTPDIWVLSSTSIPVLSSDQFAIGGLLQLGKWSVDAEFYRKWNRGQVANSTQLLQSDAAWGNSDAIGMDCLLQFNHKGHRAMVSYSFVNALSTYSPWISGRIVESYFRKHEVKCNYEWKRGHWSFSVMQLLSSGAPYTSLLGTYTLNLPGNNQQVLPVMGDLNTDRTSYYMRTDFMAGYHWNWGGHRLALNAGVYNLFDRQNYRGIQYSVQRQSAESGDYTVQQRKVLMIGRIPSIHLSWQF